MAGSLSSGIDEQMDVLGHEDKRNQLETTLLARFIDRSGQITAPGIVRQQFHLPIARECQLMQIARLMVMLDRFELPRLERWPNGITLHWNAWKNASSYS